MAAVQLPLPALRRATRVRPRYMWAVLAALLLACTLAYADHTTVPFPSREPAALVEPPPCTGPDCLPQPDTSPLPDSDLPVAPESPDGNGASKPGGMSGWVARGVTAALNSFFEGLVSAALNPLLDLLGETLLATPTPDSLPRIGQLWNGSWQITLACYGLLVAVAGVVVMTHGSVQSRYSVREIGPRIPLGFLAAALSLFVAQNAIELANAITEAVLGEGLDKKSAGAALRDFVLASLASNTNIFIMLLWGLVDIALLVLVLTYLVRVALTVLLIVGAPLALMCHALPQTDGVARWWWRLFGGVLAIQVVQSLALIVALRIFLTPGSFRPFGATRSGLVNVLVALALLYVLIKIPFWVLRSAQIGRGHSVAGRLVRAVVAYKTFGLLRGTAGHHGTRRSLPRSSARVGRSGRHSGSAPGAPPPPPGGGATPTGPRTPPHPPGSPLFLAPGQTPPPSPRRASGPPPLPRFQEPGAPPSGASPSTPPQPRPLRPPGLPRFRAPTGASTPATTRRLQPPGLPRFQEPVQRPSPPPVRATGRPAPITFRPPTRSAPPPRRGRSPGPGGERS